jgi:hypothetical protein
LDVSTIRYRTGLKIPRCGIYRVFHSGHPLPAEVTLVTNEDFPGCAQCEKAVHFEFIRKVDIDPEGFRVVLYQIPPITPARTRARDHGKTKAA